jgi:hypothetical protein
MGDRGGKKDKEKQKQQQAKKHEADERKKHDKAPSKVAAMRPLPGGARSTTDA